MLVENRRDDLQDLLTDEAYQAAFVNALPQVEEALKQVGLLERENESLAGGSPFFISTLRRFSQADLSNRLLRVRAGLGG